MQARPPLNLKKWIDTHREQLRPPVGNKLLFQDAEFIVMAVGGPNLRKDFHHDPGEELFMQVEGEMLLRTVQNGALVDIPIRAGEVYLLPANVPHSPQRPEGSVGLVIERRRGPLEHDGFSWYCEKCGQRLHLERVSVNDIESELPQIFARFYSNAALCTCAVCGTVMQAPV